MSPSRMRRLSTPHPSFRSLSERDTVRKILTSAPQPHAQPDKKRTTDLGGGGRHQDPSGKERQVPVEGGVPEPVGELTAATEAREQPSIAAAWSLSKVRAQKEPITFH